MSIQTRHIAGKPRPTRPPKPLVTTTALELSAVDFGTFINALIDQNPNPILVLRWSSPDVLACPVVYVNDRFKVLTGFTIDDFNTGECQVISQLYSLPTAKRRARHALANKKSDGIEASMHAKDGRTLYVDISLMTIPSNGADSGYIVLDLHDITEVKQIAERGVALGADMESVLASARCLVWHAILEDHTGSHCWNIGVTNDGAARNWLPVDVLPGEPFFQAVTRSVHPEDQQRMDARYRAAIRDGESKYSQEFRVWLTKGEYRWLSEDVQVERLAPHRWRLVGVIIDVSDKKTAEARLSQERNLLRTLIDNLPDCVYVKDTQSRFVINNSFHARMLGAETPDAVAGQTESAFFTDTVASEHHRDEASIIETGIPLINQEEPVVLPTGRRVWHSNTKVPLRDANGDVVGLVGISRDITAQKQLEVEREQLLIDALDRANRDPLTGLWNHRAFQKRLEDQSNLAMANGTSVAIVVMDMDNFKFFNDAYGHTVGDDVLCEVSRALRSACRPEDTLSRFGGDEFALLMPVAEARFAEELAIKVAGSLKDLGYRPDGAESIVPIAMSWGMAVFPDESPSRLDVLALADGRLMRAKAGFDAASELTDRLSTQLAASDKGLSILNALVTSVDNKDRYTRQHSEDVLTYAIQIARELGLDEATCRQIQVVALLHDVGKIGVPDHILRKPGPLTADEYEAVKLHPTMGAIIVGAVPGCEDTLPAIKHHHERWDGRGYPDGLTGEETPLIARLLAVADAFSAMTTDRPYRKGMTGIVAEQILVDGAGTQWDAQLVEAFIAARHKSPDA